MSPAGGADRAAGPLAGKRVLVTRARAQTADLAIAIEDLGGEVEEFPTIAIGPPSSYEALDRAIDDLASFDWIVFTSANGVKALLERIETLGIEVPSLDRTRICAIGPATRAALKQVGMRVDLVPAEYRAEGILEAMGREGLRGKRILIPRAAVAREILPQTLREAGAEVLVAQAYRTERPREAAEKIDEVRGRIRAGEIHAITFTSSSTVENFVTLLGDEEPAGLLDGLVVASIGPITAEAAARHGIRTDVQPAEYTVPALVRALGEHFDRKGQGTSHAGRRGG